MEGSYSVRIVPEMAGDRRFRINLNKFKIYEKII